MCYVYNQWYDISCATLYITDKWFWWLVTHFGRPSSVSPSSTVVTIYTTSFIIEL